MVDGDGRYTGVFDMWDLLALLLPKAATLDDLVPNLSFLSDDLPALQQRMKEIGGQPVGPLARPDLPLLRPDTSPVEALLLFYRNRSTLPVVDEASGKLVGVMSYWDALAAISGRKCVMESAGGVWFGWDPFWVSTIILIITYAVIMTERVNRAIVALLGAGADDPGRRHQPGAGDRRRRLQHAGAAHRHDAAGGHRQAQRHVPVSGDLGGQARPRASPGRMLALLRWSRRWCRRCWTMSRPCC